MNIVSLLDSFVVQVNGGHLRMRCDREVLEMLLWQRKHGNLHQNPPIFIC